MTLIALLWRLTVAQYHEMIGHRILTENDIE